MRTPHTSYKYTNRRLEEIPIHTVDAQPVKVHWHHYLLASGRDYCSKTAVPPPLSQSEYEAMIRRAYGSLRGVKVYEVAYD